MRAEHPSARASPTRKASAEHADRCQPQHPVDDQQHRLDHRRKESVSSLRVLPQPVSAKPNTVVNRIRAGIASFAAARPDWSARSSAGIARSGVSVGSGAAWPSATRSAFALSAASGRRSSKLGIMIAASVAELPGKPEIATAGRDAAGARRLGIGGDAGIRATPAAVRWSCAAHPATGRRCLATVSAPSVQLAGLAAAAMRATGPARAPAGSARAATAKPIMGNAFATFGWDVYH